MITYKLQEWSATLASLSSLCTLWPTVHSWVGWSSKASTKVGRTKLTDPFGDQLSDVGFIKCIILTTNRAKQPTELDQGPTIL